MNTNINSYLRSIEEIKAPFENPESEPSKLGLRLVDVQKVEIEWYSRAEKDRFAAGKSDLFDVKNMFLISCSTKM